MDLFVYGTLMNSELVRGLTGRVFPCTPARLADFRRIEPPGGFPYVVPCRGGAVDGLVLRGVDEAAMRRLDEYEGEGEIYLRTEVTVDTAAGPLRCAVYVAPPGASGRLERA